MLQEALVIFSCLNGYNCDRTTAAYAHYNPLVVKQFETIQNKLEGHLNPMFKSTVVPIILAGASRQVNLNISRNVFLNINNNGRLSLTLNITLK